MAPRDYPNRLLYSRGNSYKPFTTVPRDYPNKPFQSVLTTPKHMAASPDLKQQYVTNTQLHKPLCNAAVEITGMLCVTGVFISLINNIP